MAARHPPPHRRGIAHDRRPYRFRLKTQGLWRWAEGQSRLAEESVDEFGPSLDLPEPGADGAPTMTDPDRRPQPFNLMRFTGQALRADSVPGSRRKMSTLSTRSSLVSPVQRLCPCRLAGRADRCWDVMPARWGVSTVSLGR